MSYKRYFSILFILAIIPFIHSCKTQRATKTSPFPQIAQTGRETWNIAGKEYQIESTYIIIFKNGVQYTINYVCDENIDIDSLNKDKALEIAFPIIRYAYDNDLYKKKHVKQNGKDIKVDAIGVAIMKQKSEAKGLVTKSHMYKVSLSLGEIKNIIMKNN